MLAPQHIYVISRGCKNGCDYVYKCTPIKRKKDTNKLKMQVLLPKFRT